jgi:hypothetical protein
VSALHALGVGLRRVPQLLALAVLSLLGYGVAVLVARLSFALAAGVVRGSLDPRASLLATVVAALPALLLAYAVHVWHDVARVHAVAARGSAFAATTAAWRDLVRTPRGTLGAYALALAATAVPTSVELAASVFAGTAHGPGLGWLLLLQPLALLARVCVRAGWIAHLTRPWRAGAA